MAPLLHQVTDIKESQRSYDCDKSQDKILKTARDYGDQFTGFDGVNPDDEVEEYTNVWGDTIARSGCSEIIINRNTKWPSRGLGFPGSEGHAFGYGFFIINEEWHEIYGFDDFDEYQRLQKKYKFSGLVITGLYEEFKDYDFYVSRGPDNCIAINDRHIVPNCFYHPPENESKAKEQLEDIISKVTTYKGIS